VLGAAGGRLAEQVRRRWAPLRSSIEGLCCWQLLRGPPGLQAPREGGHQAACPPTRSEPLLTIPTGTYNFCCASTCTLPPPGGAGAALQQGRPRHSSEQQEQQQEKEQEPCPGSATAAAGPTLLAVAGAEPSEVDVWDLRSGQPCAVLQQAQEPSHGMCMALALLAAPAQCPVPGGGGAGGSAAAAAATQPQGGALGAVPGGSSGEGPGSPGIARAPGSPHGPSSSSSSSLHLVAGYEDGMVALWDLRRPDCPVVKARLHQEPVMCLAVHPLGAMGLTGGADGHVAMFALDAAAGQLQELRRLPLPAAGTGSVCFRPDGRICASGGWDGKVRVFHSKRLEPLALLKVRRGGRGRVAGWLAGWLGSSWNRAGLGVDAR
jgi:hypothetical protein